MLINYRQWLIIQLLINIPRKINTISSPCGHIDNIISGKFMVKLLIFSKLSSAFAIDHYEKLIN